MKRFLSVILAFTMLFSTMFSVTLAFAEDQVILVYTNDGEESFTFSENEFSGTLKSALSFCDNASEENPYTIVLPEGMFNIYDNLVLRSNTTIDMTAGTVLNLDTETGTNIFKNPRKNIGYDDLVNFNMIGGTLRYTDSFNSTSCLIRLIHGSNILFKDVNFISNGYAHCIEIAACRDLIFDGCSFTCEVEPQKSSGEALQIDILDPDKHFANMNRVGEIDQYDYTMNDGITVTNCSFENLRRGLGTQSIFVGYYQNNINITNNTFDGIDEAAISCSNFVNSTVSNNTITNAGWGIKYTMMKSTDYMSDVCIARDADGNDVYGVVNKNCNSIIKDNKISVIKTVGMPTPRAIESFGIDTTNVPEFEFPVKDFYVSNLTISRNDITTSGYGIRLFDTKNSIVSSNVVKSTNKTEQGIYLSEKSNTNTISSNNVSSFLQGISIRGKSTSNKVSSNTITSVKSNGVNLYEGSSANITSNTITSAGDTAIIIKDATATDVNSNKISKPVNNGICVIERSTVKNVKSNSISSAGSNAILFKASNATDVNSNTITSSKNHGVCVQDKSTIKNIKSNTITSAGGNGILIKGSTTTDINSNKISKANNHGICLIEKSKATNVNSNNVSYSKVGHGIYFDGTSKATCVKSNTLSSNKQFGLFFNSGSSASVYNNTYSKNSKGSAYSKGSKSYTFSNLGTPSSVSVSKKGTTATIKWKKVSNATSYQIYRSTSKSGTYTKIATVSSSKLSYKNSKLTKKKTYYYKVRAIRKMNIVTAYSNYSSIKYIKI